MCRTRIRKIRTATRAQNYVYKFLFKLELAALTRTPSVEENILHVRHIIQTVSCSSGRQEVCQSMTSFCACLEIADSLQGVLHVDTAVYL